MRFIIDHVAFFLSQTALRPDDDGDDRSEDDDDDDGSDVERSDDEPCYLTCDPYLFASVRLQLPTWYSQCELPATQTECLSAVKAPSKSSLLCQVVSQSGAARL